MKTNEIHQRAYERSAACHIRWISGWARMKLPAATDAAVAARNADMQAVARDIVTRIDAVRDDVGAMSALYREWRDALRAAPEMTAWRNLIPIAINALAALSMAKGVQLS